jgi:hypothetical protein
LHSFAVGVAELMAVVFEFDGTGIGYYLNLACYFGFVEDDIEDDECSVVEHMGLDGFDDFVGLVELALGYYSELKRDMARLLLVDSHSWAFYLRFRWLVLRWLSLNKK